MRAYLPNNTTSSKNTLGLAYFQLISNNKNNCTVIKIKSKRKQIYIMWHTNQIRVCTIPTSKYRSVQNITDYTVIAHQELQAALEFSCLASTPRWREPLYNVIQNFRPTLILTCKNEDKRLESRTVSSTNIMTPFFFHPLSASKVKHQVNIVPWKAHAQHFSWENTAKY